MYHYRVEGLCHGAAARMRTREVGSHSDILTCAEVENARAAARVAVEILDANILREMGKVGMFSGERRSNHTFHQ